MLGWYHPHRIAYVDVLAEGEAMGGRIGDLSVRYHGPALDVDHSLSARALAPALLDMADAIEAAKNEFPLMQKSI